LSEKAKENIHMKNDHRIPSIPVGLAFVLAILSTPASAESWMTGPPIPEGGRDFGYR
jgi:hypothetical protein